MNLFGGTIFIFSSSSVAEMIKMGLAIVMLTSFECEENLNFLLSFFSSKLNYPPAKFFGKKAAYSTRFKNF